MNKDAAFSPMKTIYNARDNFMGVVENLKQNTAHMNLLK